MLKRLAAKLAVYLLKNVALGQPERDVLFNELLEQFKKKLLSVEERQMLTALMLDRLGALPLHAKITVDGTGEVFVNGRSLDTDAVVQLKQAAASMKTNQARRLVRDTVTWMAIVDGVHKNINPEMGLFAKAALWWLQEEDALYAKLAQGEIEDDE